MKPCRRPVRFQVDRESAVIVGMGIRPGNRLVMWMPRLSAGISHSGPSPLSRFVGLSALVRFFRTSPATSVFLFEMHQECWRS
jgi:hypothetical protein